jgi:TolB-like protein/tetratricopeptide (TPR) repeat protein
MTEEKHLLAVIMFTDIAGYTAMMGENEDKALQILRKNRDIQKTSISKHGGVWLKEMGDGILARFDSVLNAILCAQEVQKQIYETNEFKVRIGIHLGDITIENEDVFGDGVNIASRLQSIADPGGIYVSESVIRAIRARDEIKYIMVGTVGLKNVSYPVQVYAIQGEGISVLSHQKIKELSSSQSGKANKYRRITFLIAVIIIAISGWLIREFILLPRISSISSLAVLPLANLSGDPEQDYFVVGMQNALISELSKIGSLRIISRQSTIQFEGSILPMKEIARQLNVDAIVEGSVVKSSNHVWIQIQLIKPKPEESNLLAQSYDREMSDVLTMHREITRDIADRIQVKLTAGITSHLLDTGKVNPEAYEAYLKGQFQWDKLTRESLDMAENYFNLAKEKDPDYALAYMGLSIIGLGRAQMGYAPWLQVAQNSFKYIDKAMELDSTLAEVHFMNAAFNMWGLWKWEKAEQEFTKTLDLNPNYALARTYYSQFLCWTKRPEEGLEQMALALKLDPFNTLYKEIYGMNLTFTQKYREAQELLEGILKTSPDSRIALTTLRTVYHMQKKYEEAFSIWKRTYPNDPEAIEALDKGYQEGGYSKALQNLAEMLIERSKTIYVTPWQIGTIYTRAGMKKEAIEWLEKAYNVHDPNMPSIYVDPIFEYLRDEPAFMELVEKMNFPE